MRRYGVRIADASVGAGDVRYGDAGEVRLLGWSMLGIQTIARHAVSSLVSAGHAGETREIEVRTRLLGEAAARNSGAALAIVRALDLDLESAARGMSQLSPVSGRMCPRGTALGALVLDDTYNASPHAVEMALETARRLADDREGRLLAVLGDMLELGAESPQHHRRVRSRAERLCDHVVCVGPLMGATGDAVENDVAAVLKALGPLEPSDVILVKGSRSMRLERVVDGLLQSGDRP